MTGRLVSVALAVALSVGAAPVTAQRIQLAASKGELEDRVRRDSLDAAAHYNVALAYWNDKRYDDAERELKASVGMDPKFAEGYLALAYLPYARLPALWAIELDDRTPAEWRAPLEESNRMFRRAFLVNPMVDMRIIGATTPAKSAAWEMQLADAWDFYLQALDDVRQGNYEQAYGRFVRMHRERRLAGPGQGKLPLFMYWYQGIAAAHTQRWEEAREAFNHLIAESKEYERKQEEKKQLIRIPLQTNEYRYMLATIEREAGRTEQALTLYREAVENDIGLYMAHVQMANILEAQREYDSALQERERAVNANPDDPSLLTDLGVTYGKARRLGEAEAMLQRALEANPKDVRPLFWLGMAQLEQGKRDAAVATLTRFVALAPSRWEKQVTMANQRLAGLQ